MSVDKYKAEEHCWLNVEADTIWAFVGPVVFVLGVRTRPSASRSVCQVVCVFSKSCLIDCGRMKRTTRFLWFTSLTVWWRMMEKVDDLPQGGEQA